MRGVREKVWPERKREEKIPSVSHQERKAQPKKHTLIIFLLCAAHLNLFQLLHTLKSFAVLSFPVCENLPTQSILIFAVYSAEVLFFFFLLPNGRERK